MACLILYNKTMTDDKHLLYSFRRCPYAMRARMALVRAQIPFYIHEVDLKDKPQSMLDISPKGTVPVLQTANGQVIDRSIEIVEWASGEAWADVHHDLIAKLTARLRRHWIVINTRHAIRMRMFPVQGIEERNSLKN